jgi:hypothetical protein
MGIEKPLHNYIQKSKRISNGGIDENGNYF